jgi:hypothetical protein
MPINFPETLPNVRMSDYGFKPGNANLRTDMEAGLARVRRRFLSVPSEMQVSWELTPEELGIFEKFYDTDTFGGSAWFNIKLVNGAGETTYSARFKEPYSAKTTAREYMWMVSATLEVLSRPLPV